MKTDNIEQHIQVIESLQDEILSQWVEDEKAKSVLEKYIDPQLFKSKFASKVVKYYIDVIKKEKEIGDCPAIRSFLDYCSAQEVPSSELYLICAGFKKALVGFFFKHEVITEEIFYEAITIADLNLAGVLDLYDRIIKAKSELILEKENWLKQYLMVIEESLIVSRTDPKGHITYVNDNFCSISGYQRDELIGESHNIIRHKDMPKEVFEDLWNTIKSKKTWTGVIKNRKKDGSYYFVNTIVFPILNTQGEIIEYMSTRIDITEVFDLQKENERNQKILMQQSKMAEMGQLIGAIAHQLKQPLNAIGLSTQTLQEFTNIEGFRQERLNECVSETNERIRYMTSSINDLRNFFRPDKKKHPYSLIKAIETTLSMLSSQIRGKGITLESHLTDVTVQGIESELQQVILNIVTNAKDAILEKKVKSGVIKLNLTQENDRAVLTIEDNAGGIPAEIIDKVFDSYFTTKGEEGTGIGLHLAKMIIEDSMDGAISVSNSDIGAVFTVKLPVYNY